MSSIGATSPNAVKAGPPSTPDGEFAPPSNFTCAACGSTESAIFLDQVPDRLGVTGRTHRYVRCKRCSLVALHPRPTFEETAQFYPQSFWRTGPGEESEGGLSKRAETWLRARLIDADFSLVAHHFIPGRRHLDVGCATGDFMLLCQSRGTISSGIELSTSAAEHCRLVRGLNVIAGDLVDHPFGGERFDLITYNGVLEHVPDPSAHLTKCRTLLAPGGKLVILGLPNINAAGFRIAKRRWIGLDAPRHIHQFSLESVRGLLGAKGFQVTEVIQRSPRFNPPSLVASVFPSLHRHHFDAYEARTGHNPVARKALLLGLLQVARPIDAALSLLGFSEHMTIVAEAG